jgi:MFS family permease
VSPAALRLSENRNLLLFLIARFCSAIAVVMFAVGVGWQLYMLTGSPFALGMAGLAQFLPHFLLTLPGGLAADRFDRKGLLLVAFGLEILVGLALLLCTRIHAIAPIYAAVAFIGVARAIMAPANGSLLPWLVPTEHFSRAVAMNSTVFMVATIAGPALAGALYAFGPTPVYALATGLLLVGIGAIALMRGSFRVASGLASLQALLEGVRFVFQRRAVLGAISLDLFAVLFGGATALLPIFARDILLTGPIGLGILRSAPAAGATLVALWLAHRPIRRNAGRKMFACVALFGVATIVFGLSTHLWLSIAALVVLGGADMVSVVIRGTLVQVATPNEMRGRVSAVNMLFVGASNELGEFESGITAGWFGTVRATVLGGMGTLAVVAVWLQLFPSLRNADRLEDPVA